MYQRQGTDVAAVMMEPGAVHILRGIRIAEDTQGIIGTVAVVVKENDLGGDAVLFEKRSQMSLDKQLLIQIGHHHAGCVVGIERFILDGDGIDRDPFFGHGLDVFYKVKRIGIVALLFQGAAADFAVGLHPRGSRPGRAHDLDIRIDGQYLFQHREDAVMVMPQIEFFHFKIGLPFRQIVIGINKAVQITRAETQTDITEPDTAFITAKAFLQYFRASFSGHGLQMDSASPGERESKTVHGLKSLTVIHDDGETGIAAPVEIDAIRLFLKQG